MKGQKWRDRYLKGVLRFSFPVVVEEKRDEIRAHFKLVHCVHSGSPVGCEVVSFAGNPLYNLESQCAWVYSVLLRHGLTELDCGIEVNANFDDTYRYVRTKRGIPKDLVGCYVVVLLFDVPESKLEYGMRLEYMRDIIRTAKRVDFQRPLHWVAENEAQIDQLYAHCRSLGVEGVMVKTVDHIYSRSRSWSWYKRKPEETHDGIITAVHEATCTTAQPLLGLAVGDKLGRTGSVSVLLEDGSTASPHGIPHALGRQMHYNPEAFVGKQWVEFTCMERDRQGGYRHPIFKRVREAKA
jgi:hypothetical protein